MIFNWLCFDDDFRAWLLTWYFGPALVGTLAYLRIGVCRLCFGDDFRAWLLAWYFGPTLVGTLAYLRIGVCKLYFGDDFRAWLLAWYFGLTLVGALAYLRVGVYRLYFGNNFYFTWPFTCIYVIFASCASIMFFSYLQSWIFLITGVRLFLLKGMNNETSIRYDRSFV